MLDGVWLVDTQTDELTATKIRDYIVGLNKKNANVIVLEVSPVTWSSYGTETDKHSFSRWIKKYWSSTD